LILSISDGSDITAIHVDIPLNRGFTHHNRTPPLVRTEYKPLLVCSCSNIYDLNLRTLTQIHGTIFLKGVVSFAVFSLI